MLKSRSLSIFCVAALAGLAACGADEPEAEADAMGGVVTDTLVERDTSMVPVVAPVVTADSAAVMVDADTAVSVDVDVDREVVPLNPPQP